MDREQKKPTESKLHTKIANEKVWGGSIRRNNGIFVVVVSSFSSSFKWILLFWSMEKKNRYMLYRSDSKHWIHSEILSSIFICMQIHSTMNSSGLLHVLYYYIMDMRKFKRFLLSFHFMNWIHSINLELISFYS